MTNATSAMSPHDDRARRVVKAILAVVIGPIALGALIVLVLASTPWGNERVRRVLVSQVNKRITGELTIDRLRGNLLSGGSFSKVQLLDSLKHPVFTARGVKVQYGLMAALGGRIVIKSMELDTAVIVLDKPPGARWNFQSLLRPSSTPKDTTRKGATPELGNITIRHGRILYRRPWTPDATLSTGARDSAVAAALGPNARKRTIRVSGGYQRTLDYRNIDARLPMIALAHDKQPMAVQIAALSMIAEPYRPPSIDVRSLVGTLYASKDSLWWRGAHMVMPGSNVTGDGTIGFRHSGFLLDLTGSPVALADLRWLDPRLTANGGGTLRYRMRLKGDSAEFAIENVKLKYDDASLVGNASVVRVSKGKHSELIVKGADFTVAHLRTALIRELAPSVRLTRSGTLDGHVMVSGKPSAMLVDADLRFDDAAAGRSHVIARGGIGLAGGVQARDLKVQLLPLQMATLSGAGLKIPLGGVLSGGATVSGAKAEGWSVNGDITHVEHDARSRVIGTGRYQVAGKRLIADATLSPLSLVTVGKFAPAAQLRGSVAGKVHAEGTTHELRVSGVLHSQDGGRIDGRGTVGIAGPRTRYDVSVALDALNAAAFSRKAPSTRLSGTLAVRGLGTSPSTANAVFAANLEHSRFDTFTVERVVARGGVASGFLRLDTLNAVERGVHALARGTFGLVSTRRGTLQFSLRVDSLQSLRPLIGTTDTALVSVASGRQGARLAAARADSTRRAEALRIEQLALGLSTGVSLATDPLPPIRRDSLAGSLVASGALTGNVKELGIDATVRGSGLVVRGNAARRLDGQVASTNVRDRGTPLTYRLDADSVQASGFGFEHVHAAGRWQDKRIYSGVRIRQDSLVSYAALGSYGTSGDGLHDVRLDTLRMQFDTLVWRLAHPGAVRFGGGNVVVDSIDLRSSAAGRLYANGIVPKDGAARLDVVAEEVRVSTVLRALQRDMDAEGRIGVTAHLLGTRAAPAISGRATLRDAEYKGNRAPDGDVTMNYAAQRLALDATARDSVGRRVLAATASLPLDLSLAGVTGSRKLPGALIADVRIDTLALAALPLNSGSFDDIRGLLVADAHVRGGWDKPQYTGSAALRNGGVLVASTGMRVDSAVADLRLTGDSLFLDSLVAHARGALRASGTVSLADAAHPFVHLIASGQNLRVMDAARGLLDVNADAVAIGPLDALRVTGRGVMLGGFLALKQFRKDLLRVKSPGELSYFAVFDTSAAAGDAARVASERAQHRRVAILADLSLTVDRGTYFRNRPDANTEFFTGSREVVRARIDQRSSDQWAIGFVRIGDGVAFFRTLAFVPARGSLTFGPHTDAVGIVQQVGERQVWEPGRGIFPLQFLTGGTSKAPAVGLESGTLFPIRGRELNTYLTLGRLSTSLLQQSGSSLSGSEAWSGQLSGESGALAHRQQGATALGVVLHDIGTGATKEYGLDAFSVSPADVPTELVFGKTGGVRGALIEAGRYVTTDRYVAGQLRFTSGIPGIRMAQKFGTIYRLDLGVEPRFLFRAPEDLGITHPTTRAGAFGAFLTRLWDF